MNKNILLSILFLLLCFSFVNAKPVSKSEVLCYQEFANESTSCGGLSTGSYYVNEYDKQNIYINYSKPLFATNNSKWIVKYSYDPILNDGITHNLSIPQSCWNYNKYTLQLRLYSWTGFSDVASYCYNGTEWVTIEFLRLAATWRCDGDGLASMAFDGNWNTGVCAGWRTPVFNVNNDCAYAMLYEEKMAWAISSKSNSRR